MKTDSESFLLFLRSYETFALVGHEDPDGDCLGSQLALASLLLRMGKRSCLVSPGPFARAEIVDLAHRFSTSISRCDENPTAAVVVDCSTAVRTGSVAAEIAELPTAVIDHHAAGEAFGDARYIDTTAPSVTYMIATLMQSMGYEINKQEAEWLLFGLCTDTGFFRHLDDGAGEAFRVASLLVEAGASPKSVHRAMYGHRTLESRRLVGTLLARARSVFGGRVLLTWQDADDLRRFGRAAGDSDTVYRELQRVEGCETVVLVRAESDESCSVGLRSFDRIDVGEIARRFGGGGHKNASGYTAEGTVESTCDRIVAALQETLVDDSSRRSDL